MDNEQKFTPGPWFVSPQGVFVRYHNGEFGDANICKMGQSAPLDEDEANARLIAAAPELYEALKAVVSDPKVEELRFVNLDFLKRALAKVSVPRATAAR